ncbi:MAG: hypothetical protein H6765_10540 [Candidatus Peribacteria bacterium]|nr:MAG: hypothetical protein H6765_10540 [Candidatus Peribacteria bacterium]
MATANGANIQGYPNTTNVHVVSGDCNTCNGDGCVEDVQCDDNNACN